MGANIPITGEMLDIIKHTRIDRIRARDKARELKSITNRLEYNKQKLEALENNERYFYNNLSIDANFEKRKEFRVFSEYLPDLTIKYKRIFVLINTLREFLKKNSITDEYGLDTKALTQIIECYMDDLHILKKRYNCPSVQLPKIGGLMMNLIVKYRPIIPLETENNHVTDINETFAVYHALCICSDFSEGAELVSFEQTTEHSQFYKDMIYLLHRNYTPECLIMILKVLCLYQFKSFLMKAVDG